MRQRVLVLSDAEDSPARDCLQNVVTALDQTRIDFVVHDLAGPLDFPDLAGFSIVVTATESLWRLDAATVGHLESFVAAGGGLFCAYRSPAGRLADLLGIVEETWTIASGIRPAEAGGLRFVGSALPAFANLTLYQQNIVGHAGLEQFPRRDAQLLATTYGGKPVAWTRAHGNGRIAYWNSRFLGQRRARGLIVQTLELVVPISVIPCANAGVIQIDDFPAPLQPTLPTVLREEFPGLTPQEFHSRIWYPDMMDLARRRGITYSCYCIFDYVHPEGMDASLIDPHVAALNEIAFDAIRADPPAEIGLHGLNHNSLHTRYWPSDEAMRDSLRTVRQVWQSCGLGEPPRTYVPPNNLYDMSGMAALHAILPECRIICGDFFGDATAIAPREFGPEPWQPELFCMPRVTSGHECDDNVLFMAVSQAATFGVWTHFLHPDDVSDTPSLGASSLTRRNPHSRPWRGSPENPGLLSQFERLVASVQARMPWMTFRSAAEAAEIVEAHLASSWESVTEGDTVRISGPVGGHVRLCIDLARWPRIVDMTGCESLHREIAGGRARHVLRLTQDSATITLSEQTRLGAWFDRLRTRSAPSREDA